MLIELHTASPITSMGGDLLTFGHAFRLAEIKRRNSPLDINTCSALQLSRQRHTI